VRTAYKIRKKYDEQEVGSAESFGLAAGDILPDSTVSGEGLTDSASDSF
jgi:hypothetical protein